MGFRIESRGDVGRERAAPPSLTGPRQTGWAWAMAQATQLHGPDPSKDIKRDDVIFDTWMIETGDGDDNISVEQDSATKEFIVTINGKQIRRTDISTISIRSGGGTDVVTTPARSLTSDAPHPGPDNSPVNALVYVDAGDGDDKVDLSAVTRYDTTIVGGDGRDTLVGGHSDCGSTDIRTDYILGGTPFDDRNPDTIYVRPDSANQRTLTDAPPQEGDIVLSLPGQTCAVQEVKDKGGRNQPRSA